MLLLNGQRGIEVARRLVGAGHGLALAVIPSARAQKPSLVHCLSPLQVETIAVADANARECIERIRSCRPNLMVVAGYSQILRREVRETARHGAINLHAGKLPRYRGGSPLNWQIINGEKEAGLSIIQLDDGIDTGDILAQATIDIGPDDTIGDLHERAVTVFPRLVLQVIAALESGNLNPVRQCASQSAYWHQRNDEDGRVDWGHRTATEVHNLVRGLTRPYPGAFTYWGERRVRIFKTRVPDFVLRGVPGRVCYVQRRGPYVVCRDRALLVDDYQVSDAAPDRLIHGSHLC